MDLQNKQENRSFTFDAKEVDLKLSTLISLSALATEKNLSLTVHEAILVEAIDLRKMSVALSQKVCDNEYQLTPVEEVSWLPVIRQVLEKSEKLVNICETTVCLLVDGATPND